MTCKLPICSSCAVADHNDKSHEPELLEKAIEKERQELIPIDENKIQPKINQLKKTLKTIQMKESLIEKENEMKQKIEKIISELHHLIDQKNHFYFSPLKP